MRAIILAIALALGGCASGDKLGSIAGGESKVFTAPSYVVLGKTQYDQDWIDGNVVAGVAAFNWPLPKPRPASFDNAPPPRRIAKPTKKPGIIKRIKALLTREKPAEIIAPAAPPVVISPPMIAAPPPKPCDPVGNLLGTCGK
mgnify:CR=1 FL=1